MPGCCLTCSRHLLFQDFGSELKSWQHCLWPGIPATYEGLYVLDIILATTYSYILEWLHVMGQLPLLQAGIL